MALGTNYTLTPGLLDTRGALTQRDRLMLHHYQSPFVFRRSLSHFTLASPKSIPNDRDRSWLIAQVENRFAGFLAGQSDVMIDAIHVLSRKRGADRWDAVSRREFRFAHQG
jgi:hypothetical protein